MAGAIPIYQQGSGTQTFYVPAFEIKMRGHGLPRDVLRDVMQVTYKDSINDDMDSVELTINNWDDTTRKFKYVGLDDSDPRASKGLFNPGQEVEVYMGYQQPFVGPGNSSALKLMMIGQVTTLEQDFPNAGSPTLQVRAQNVLRNFLKQKHTYPWKDLKDSEIAKKLGQMPVSKDHPGLGIEVRIDKESLANEARQPIVFMHDQFDLLFLLERARAHGYSVYLGQEQKKRFLYFGPSDRDTFITYKLEWGKSLVQFHPTLTTTKQVSHVTIRGWEPAQ